MPRRRGLLREWSFNSSRRYLRRYNEEFAEDMQEDMLVLDAGAGEQPYYDIFSRFRYESADFEQVEKEYAPSTYVCDLSDIPVEDGRFDRVILNQVLEHLPEPKKVLRELNRVLKPGGKILCTCPLFFPEHEQPYDFYRYTQFAHRYLFSEAGFEIERLEWMEGYFGTIATQLQQMRWHIPGKPRYYTGHWYTLAAYPVALGLKFGAHFMTGVFSRLDMAVKVTDRGYPKNYAVIARKP